MAQITGLVTLSHSPWWDLEGEIRGPGESFVGGVKKVVDRVRALSPDVIVVFGPDHFRNFFYDLMPPFCIGIERVEGFGDFWSPKGELPSAPRLAGEIYRGVIAAGFDPAFSLNMSVDHGITQPYAALNPDRTTPILPIMVNASGAPRPSLRRWHSP
jgi:2,3-dihydroxyphenylpropionate 1,2-dioxygenase